MSFPTASVNPIDFKEILLPSYFFKNQIINGLVCSLNSAYE
jgi:hypothetical protein